MSPRHREWYKGYIHVYTGNGKGKTTAAFGLALRAVGAGFKVFIAQFIKSRRYSELVAFERYSDMIDLRQYGRGCFIRGKPKEEDIQLAAKGLEDVKNALSSSEFRIVILDEANVATHFGLFSVEDLLSIMDSKPEEIELIITGRYADQRVIEKADLVTEMREIKHYYKNGVLSRVGIEK